VFCIGGIKKDNLPLILAAGAHRVVIVSGLLQAEDPAAYARSCRELLGTADGTI
jgi:thiamine-phosphate pyrophosphorylase